MNKYPDYLRNCAKAVLIIGMSLALWITLIGMDIWDNLIVASGIAVGLLAVVLYYVLLACAELLNNTERQTKYIEKLTEHFCGELPIYEEVQEEQKDE